MTSYQITAINFVPAGLQRIDDAVTILADADAEAPEFVGMPRWFRDASGSIYAKDSDGSAYRWDVVS